jgi:hypothetical protein
MQRNRMRPQPYEKLARLAAHPGMRPFALLLLISAAAIARDFVRPWVVPPPNAAVPTLQFRAPDVPPPSRPAPLLMPAGFPFPIILTPCTWFPGNPVFVIEGDKITMRKAPDR